MSNTFSNIITRPIISLIIFFASSIHISGFTVKGFVYDLNSKPLVGANVILNSNEYVTVTNSHGGFSFNTIPRKKYKLVVSHLGYNTYSKQILPNNNLVVLQIKMNPSDEMIAEVVVKNNKSEKLKKEKSICIELIEEEFLKENKAGSLMETLNKIPGVNSVDIGSGLSKPMIRGMSYYRIAVAMNGIKQEGQQWSNHHGLIIDQNAVDHIELIKGPASLRYGSDAIGGVINILPLHLPLREELNGEVSVIGKINNNWFGISGDLSTRKKDVFFQVNFTFNKYGDFVVPNTNSFLLPTPANDKKASHEAKLGKYIINTAGDEHALSFITGIIKPWGKSYFVVSNYQNKSGFFDWESVKSKSQYFSHQRNSNDIQLPCQKNNHLTINHFSTIYFNKNKLEVSFGFQSNLTKEYANLSDRTGNRASDLDKYNSDKLDLLLHLNTYSGNICLTNQSIKNQKIEIGLTSQFQHHTKDGFNHILPEYKRLIIGSFLIHEYSISDNYILNNGIRFDLGSVELKESLNPDPSYGNSIFNPYFQKKYPGFAFSTGLNYLPDKQTIIKLNIGKSYRIPSTYELGAYGLHRHEIRFEKGSSLNNSETAWHLDIGFEKKWEKSQFSVSPFLNYFTNYLYLKPTSELRLEGQVYEYQQSKAVHTGGEATMSYNFPKSIDIQLNAEYVYTINMDIKQPIPATPPLNMLAMLNYSFRDLIVFKSNQIGLEANYIAAQNYTVPNELSTPSCIHFGAIAKTRLKTNNQTIDVILKIKNLFNTRYYKHISFYRRLRIPEPGRDIQLFITIPIQKSTKF